MSENKDIRNNGNTKWTKVKKKSWNTIETNKNNVLIRSIRTNKH